MGGGSHLVQSLTVSPRRESIRVAHSLHPTHKLRSHPMTLFLKRNCTPMLMFAAATLVFASLPTRAQQSDGPQVSPPPSAQRVQQAAAPPSAPGLRIVVPAGTRFAVVLENGISTRGAKAGDSVYLRTSFPITQDNKVVVPVGSYLRGELTEAKRPGRVKGRGELDR